MKNPMKDQGTADVCLILEGTYPYVTGGVSSWVNQLIKALPDIKFGLVTIIPTHEVYGEFKYVLPDNILWIQKICIHEKGLSSKSKWSTYGQKLQAINKLEHFYSEIYQGRMKNFDEIFRAFIDEDTRIFSPENFLHDRAVWELIKTRYLKNASETSFLDYFWNFRFVHLPVLNLISSPIPKAGVYHTVSTGYAGLFAALCKIKWGAPVMITEHGIYTRERRIEIDQADWIADQIIDRPHVATETSVIRKMWNSLFSAMSLIAYEYCDTIITLYEGNRKLQIAEGAPIHKTSIIPNGIDLSGYKPGINAFDTKMEYNTDRPRVGFMGRVVSIKDVKTFIRAAAIVHREFPDCVFPVMGPYDEEPEYYDECIELTNFLGLEGSLEYTGRVDAAKEYQRLDMLVLTSISEAMPLVTLEGYACGIPCIATDVGACSELIYGRVPEDVALGPSGAVTQVGKPEKTAEQIIRLLKSSILRKKMGRAGYERVHRFYNKGDLDFAYHSLYFNHLRGVH